MLAIPTCHEVQLSNEPYLTLSTDKIYELQRLHNSEMESILTSLTAWADFYFWVLTATKWTVQPATRTPAWRACFWALTPLNDGNSDGWMFNSFPTGHNNNIHVKRYTSNKLHIQFMLNTHTHHIVSYLLQYCISDIMKEESALLIGPLYFLMNDPIWPLPHGNCIELMCISKDYTALTIKTCQTNKNWNKKEKCLHS